MVAMIIILTISIFMLYLYHYYITYGRIGKLIFKIPGPFSIPILGNVPLIFLLKTSDIWPTFQFFNTKYYPIWRLSAFHINGTIILDPDDIEILLSSPKYIEKSILYNFLSNWLKGGLINSKGKKWMLRRKLLTPSFHFNILQKYSEIMIEHGQKVIHSLKNQTENKSAQINLIRFLTKFTLSIICETAMGTSLNENDGKRTKAYVKAVHDYGAIVFYRFQHFYNIFALNNFTFKYFTLVGWKSKNIVKYLHNFSKRIINERKNYHDETNGQHLKKFDVNENHIDKDKSGDINVGMKKRRLAMIDILISAYKRGEIDDEGIQEEVDTFIFAGHDTTATAISFTIYLLAGHRDIQMKAREEVDKIWITADGKIGINEINKMFYLERCIKESLRIFPVAPQISRCLEEDLHLKHYIVPKGTNVMISIYDLHRNENYWMDPLKFDPDRFLPEEVAKRHPYCYIPFSAGPRNCIGQKFAMMEIKTICAFVLRNFFLECKGEHERIIPTPDLILKPEKELFATFIPRTL